MNESTIPIGKLLHERVHIAVFSKTDLQACTIKEITEASNLIIHFKANIFNPLNNISGPVINVSVS
jgi:hypothetical protein